MSNLLGEFLSLGQNGFCGMVGSFSSMLDFSRPLCCRMLCRLEGHVSEDR